ncbi:TetR/AcrR family transcriptional regulator [Reyranella sp. CPCC 100927]|nr:TetR/AcrR family transcriptional regulator [Reyranella sp. CPCC 100927]
MLGCRPDVGSDAMTAGRPRDFDETHALDAAMRAFWDRGYHATSIGELVDATGVHRNSLYATFGDKKTLFLRALDAYIDGALQRFEEKLAPPRPALEALKEALVHYARIVATPAGPRGCFVTNTTIELLPQDKDVAGRIRNGFKGMVTLLETTIRRGQQNGDIAADLDPRDTALYLYTYGQGLRVVGRVWSMADLGPTVDLALRGVVSNDKP